MALPPINYRRLSPNSPLAAPGQYGQRLDNLYSSVVFQHGASGNTKLFTVPEGGVIDKVKSTSITASTQAHHDKHSELTTNLSQAGQLGNEIGDIVVEKFGFWYEQASFNSSGVPFDYGFLASDVNQILSKTTCKVQIGGQQYTKGPMRQFGQLSGIMGPLTTTESEQTLGFVSAGPIGMGRSFAKIPLQATQTDLIKVELTIANGSSLTFTTTTGEGQPGLVTAEAWVITAAEVRG